MPMPRTSSGILPVKLRSVNSQTVGTGIAVMITRDAVKRDHASVRARYDRYIYINPKHTFFTFSLYLLCGEMSWLKTDCVLTSGKHKETTSTVA